MILVQNRACETYTKSTSYTEYKNVPNVLHGEHIISFLETFYKENICLALLLGQNRYGMYHTVVCSFPSLIHSSIKNLVFHHQDYYIQKNCFLVSIETSHTFVSEIPIGYTFSRLLKCGDHLFTSLQTIKNMSRKILVSYFCIIFVHEVIVVR